MNDFVLSGFGSETTDRCLIATSIKPIWYLTPLPLAFLPLRPRPTAPLQDLCLSVISRNFSHYTLDQLSALPPSIVSRILRLVKLDRKYGPPVAGPYLNPDETTLWAYNTLIDPECVGLETDHTLAVPQMPTLHFLKPDETLADPEHPFVAIPRLFHRFNPQPSLKLLTTLTLDGKYGAVTDDTIINLRYCTNLTLLWTKGCSISDLAIRLLASSLDLEEKKGLCRLRGWFMPGCRSVGDKSMRSLAKWPGLAVIDVRDTSVTSVGIDILNKFSRSEFGGHNADFQACTSGLRCIFSGTARPSDVLDMLCLTLTPRPSSLSRRATATTSGEDERWWISLNLVPTMLQPEAQWLPHPPSASHHPDVWLPKRERGAYIAGAGMVYGNRVHEIKDDIKTYRANLKTAMRIQAEDEGLSTPVNPFPKYGLFSWNQEKKETARQKEKRLEGSKQINGPDGNVVKKQKQKRTKAVGRRVFDEEMADTVEGEDYLMLVRMAAPNWEDLRWTLKNTEVAQRPVKIATTQRGNAAGLIADILGTAGVGSESQEDVKSFLTASQLSSPPPSSSPLGTGQRTPFNPFAVRPSQPSSTPRRPSSESSQTPNPSLKDLGLQSRQKLNQAQVYCCLQVLQNDSSRKQAGKRGREGR